MDKWLFRRNQIPHAPETNKIRSKVIEHPEQITRRKQDKEENKEDDSPLMTRCIWGA